MDDFIAEYCHRYDKRINQGMFDRVYDRPLVEYIVDTCKNLEVIPAITLESWELVTDQTKIRDHINKANSKDPKIKNNKALERLISPSRTLCDMLYLNFRVRAKGRDIPVQRKVRILKPLKNGCYLRNGKMVRVLNQVVDNSTFVKGNVLNFKTKLYSIKLSTAKIKMHFTNGESLSFPRFKLDLLYKVTNPLVYYMAQYGVQDTIWMFSLENVLAVVTEPMDEDHYLYLKISKGVYIEVNEKAFYHHDFIRTFVSTFYELLKADPDITFKQVYDKTYWKFRLSEIFSKKRLADKALRILISFNKIMDTSVKRHLILGKRHKRNSFTIIRWMMTNYTELLKKDSNNLRYKRVRANETLAYFFDKHITTNVYSLLNTDNPPIEKYLRLLNSINEFTLLKGVHGGGKTSPTSMFRYERYNDLDAIEISRYTLKGPTGLNGGKQGVALTYRDIYPSQLGRFDLNVCFSSDPGLTGYLCGNVQLDESGYFDASDVEPDGYGASIGKVIDKYSDPGYMESREEHIRRELNRDEDGFVTLKRKLKGKELHDFICSEPGAHGLYKTRDGLKLIPKCENVDSKGFRILQRKKPERGMEKQQRDEDGFIILRRVSTKLDEKRRSRLKK